jgi:hypothetical protein
MNWYSVHHYPPSSDVIRCLDKNVTDCPFSCCTVGNLCVQFGIEAACFTFILNGFCACFNNLWLIVSFLAFQQQT